MRQLKQSRLRGQGLGDVASVGLQSQSSLAVIGLGARGGGCGGGGGRRGSDALRCSAFACCLGLLCLAAAFGLVGLDLGLDAPLGLEVVELLLALAGGVLDLLLALELLLGLLCLLSRLESNFLLQR